MILIGWPVSNSRRPVVLRVSEVHQAPPPELGLAESVDDQIGRLWRDLADADPAHAYWAIIRLASCPSRTPEFLGKKLTPATRADEQIDLLKDPEQLRSLRALESLEYVGTPDAQRVLKRLAEGVPGARLTQDARASLERLANETPTTCAPVPLWSGFSFTICATINRS